MISRPTLLFYCQHSLGMGHLVRSLALATALAKRFHVVFLNGGPLPRGMTVPDTIEMVSLPPLGMAADNSLISRDRRRTVARTQTLRTLMISNLFQTLRPQVVFIELFPFGRKKFAFELIPLLDAARLAPTPPLVLCSVRDILVGQRRDQHTHDERASVLTNRYFDAVLVHADPQFSRLEDSFHPQTPLAMPVYYTGFVVPERAPLLARDLTQSRQILVSAGGGIVGASLLANAIGAHALLWPEYRMPMKLIAGPFLPEETWRSLRTIVRQQRGVTLRRVVPDLCAEMRVSAVSVSQCGYNTALDIIRAEVPALVVPFSEGQEDEQIQRARRLEQLDVLRVLDPQMLTPGTLASAIRKLLSFRPQSATLDLRGAQNTADLVAYLTQQPASSAPVATTQEVQI
jgi:predicted glycosyltransferase